MNRIAEGRPTRLKDIEPQDKGHESRRTKDGGIDRMISICLLQLCEVRWAALRPNDTQTLVLSCWLMNSCQTVQLNTLSPW